MPVCNSLRQFSITHKSQVRRNSQYDLNCSGSIYLGERLDFLKLKEATSDVKTSAESECEAMAHDCAEIITKRNQISFAQEATSDVKTSAESECEAMTHDCAEIITKRNQISFANETH
ncbi:hypothetical protein WN943_009715 [Citrus x changshan-huyou]